MVLAIFALRNSPMPRLASFTLPILALLAALVAPRPAQARAWGFDRDTVYEWSAGAAGRAQLVNGGASLALDSVFVEGAGKPWGALYFAFAENAEKVFVPAVPAAALAYTLPPAAAVPLRTFDVMPSTCALKVTADSVVVDTLSVRLRVRSLAGEEDTLVVTGTGCGSLFVGLRPAFAPSPRLPGGPAGLSRDALGREVAPAPRFPVRILPERK
jgi:hypothetical protein